LLCRRHHRAVHEEGYRLAVELTARNDANWVRVQVRTMSAGWFGEPLDVGYAIDVMHPLAR
jgi:hypothetical protein